MMKKLLLLLLALSLSLTLLTACQNNDKPPVDTEEEDTEAELTTADILGFDKQNYGKEFNILLNDAAAVTKRDFFVDEGASDVVSVATNDRNLACEEYLGISINYTLEPGNWNSGMADKLYTLVSTDACDYDMVSMSLNGGIIGGYINIYQNIPKMQYIDLTHSWWVQDMIEQVSINNQLYFLTGDACVSTYAYIGCVFANLVVAENFGITEDFYDLVRNGDWTMEKFFSMYKTVGLDTDADGHFNPETETFGWANHSIGVRLMWSSADVNLIERQQDGTFALRSGLDDRIVTFIGNLKTELSDPHHAYLGDNQKAVNAFVTDRVLFETSLLATAESFKSNNIESPFAILPLPKHDKQQADYISTNMPAYNALFFPSTIKSVEMSAQVAEYMGWYGQQYVIPAYYDQALKYRQNDVEANVEMLDLIREKLRVTPNEIYGIIGETGTDTVMFLTQTINQNLADSGFYSNPVSVWKTQYPTLADRITSYVLQYFK